MVFALLESIYTNEDLKVSVLLIVKNEVIIDSAINPSTSLASLVSPKQQMLIFYTQLAINCPS